MREESGEEESRRRAAPAAPRASLTSFCSVHDLAEVSLKDNRTVQRAIVEANSA